MTWDDLTKALNNLTDDVSYITMDDDGYVAIPQGPGLGIEFNWDYIKDNFLPDLSSKNVKFED